MESLKWILIHHNLLLESIRTWILTSCCSHLSKILLQFRLPFQCRLRSVHWSNAPTGDCQQAQKARIAARRFSNILLSTIYLSCSQVLHCQHCCVVPMSAVCIIVVCWFIFQGIVLPCNSGWNTQPSCFSLTRAGFTSIHPHQAHVSWLYMSVSA